MAETGAKDLMDTKLIHVCEVCGKTELLTPIEAYAAGWDYPPILGAFGIVSPRTCPDCGMEETVWADLTLRQKASEELSEKQCQALMRILHEPNSLLPENRE